MLYKCLSGSVAGKGHHDVSLDFGGWSLARHGAYALDMTAWASATYDVKVRELLRYERAM